MHNSYPRDESSSEWLNEPMREHMWRSYPHVEHTSAATAKLMTLLVKVAFPCIINIAPPLCSHVLRS